ncbi:MAG TPA: hypothetical protein VH331_09160 [Allosphingosinicella sp.]|nr:hypothetical protein [Allosphingosinicella sp.]
MVMWIIECSPDRPWGIHPRVHNDAQCPRCGWTAPGPLGDARADAEEIAAREVMAHANELGWALLDGGSDEALAA